MTAPAIPAAIASLVLTATLAVLTPAGSRAEGPLDTRSHEARDSAPGPLANTGDLATTGFDHTARSDDTTAGDSTLAENAWDFTRPDTIPGFASTPYPVLSNPEIAD
jgi:hypothetical protein